MNEPASTRASRSETLTRESLAAAARALAGRDELLRSIYEKHGDPPLWRRDTGFPTLVHIILEQQVSLRSGNAMFDRLTKSIDPFLPEKVFELGEPFLRSLGVTRQKAHYLVQLSSSVIKEELNFRKLGFMGDADARLTLMRIKGIGAWSADVYLLMAMRRADVWPAGDLALGVAIQELQGLPERPTPSDLELLAERWRPHRAVAARMLWQHYLARRRPAMAVGPPI